jgi:hypothetical protein
MLEAFTKPRGKRTLLLLVICGVLAAAAGVVGVDDDAVGQSLAYLSAIALVLALVYPWRTTKRFLLLVGASAVGFVVFAVLSSVLDNAGVAGVGGVFFFIAAMLCPAGLLVGIIGVVVTRVTSIRAHQSPLGKPMA